MMINTVIYNRNYIKYDEYDKNDEYCESSYVRTTLGRNESPFSRENIVDEYQNLLSDFSMLHRSINQNTHQDKTTENILLIYTRVVWRIFSIVGFGSVLVLFLLLVTNNDGKAESAFIAFVSLYLAYSARYVRKKIINKKLKKI